MQKIATFEKNTYAAIVAFVTKDQAPVDLSGATVVALAKGAGPVISLGAAVHDGAAGETRLFWPAGTFLAGFYEVQLRASRDGKTETFTARLKVSRSL